MEEQTAFRRLAVFAGGFGLDAAAAVCDRPIPAVIELVSRLVDKSLVQAERSAESRRDSGYWKLSGNTRRPS